tara:strand:- start:1413 stop:5342 length:3930 start_codon:yes stop_codon:yes gene_type:complete
MKDFNLHCMPSHCDKFLKVSGNSGSVQLNSGEGTLTSDDNLIFKSTVKGQVGETNALVLGSNACLQIEKTFPNPGSGIGWPEINLENEGCIKYFNGILYVCDGYKWIPQGTTTGTTLPSLPIFGIQYNGGNNNFLADNSFTFNGDRFRIHNSVTRNEFIFDKTAGSEKFVLGRPTNLIFDLSTSWISERLTNLRLLSEPEYSDITQSIVQEPKTSTLIGVHLMSQVLSNETKGITSMWPGGPGTAQNKQMWTCLGHNLDFYSSFAPSADSILDTSNLNDNNAQSSPPTTMDLGMSSRVPFNTSNGYEGFGWQQNPWSQDTEDDPYYKDIFANTNGYSEWEGQQMFKSGIPGLYIQERRWDRIFARTNYSGSLSIRSTYAPTKNPLGLSVSGLDFYDLCVADINNITQETDLRVASNMNLGMARLNVPRDQMSSNLEQLLTITTDKSRNLSGTGVNYSAFDEYGAASILFKYAGPNANAGNTGSLLTDNYTLLLDGLKGEVKALGQIEVGSSSLGQSNLSTLSDSLLNFTSQSNVPVISFGVGSQSGVSFGETILKDDLGTDALIFKGVNASTGPQFTSIDMKTGLAYFSNSFATNDGANRDNVGVVSITHTNTTNSIGQSILYISSHLDISNSNYYQYQNNQNAINIKNETGFNSSPIGLFNVDVAGFSQSSAYIPPAVTTAGVTTICKDPSHVFRASATTAIANQSLYSGNILQAESDIAYSAGGKYYYYDPTTPNPNGGYSFFEGRDRTGKKLSLDSDGSIKCSYSFTVSNDSTGLPGNFSNSVNIVPIPGTNTISGTTGGSLVTTTYSLPMGGTSSPLQLQACGRSESPSFSGAYLNTVRVIPNEVFLSNQKYSNITAFQIAELNTTGNPTNNENLLFLTSNANVTNNESLFMTCYPRSSRTGQGKPIFELKAGGSVGNSIYPSNCFRFFPEGNNFITGTGNISGCRLILSDDNPVSRATGGSVRIGAGKSRPQSTSVTGLGGWLESDTIDTRQTFTETLDYGSTNPSGGVGALLIGAGLTKAVQMRVDTGGTGLGYIELDRTGSISCLRTGNPAGGLNGPTNICNRNHAGYIGTPGLIPADGTGLRGYSCLATTFSAVAKLYIAKNQGLIGSDEKTFTCCSSVEAPQGVIIMRGRVLLDSTTNGSITINLDNTKVSSGVNIIPHTNPQHHLPLGTVYAMYQNFTVQVTNAGTYIHGNYTPFAISFDSVGGIIEIDPISQTVSLKIETAGGITDRFVDWVVYCERKDAGYTSSEFVKTYANPVTKEEYPTWGTPGYNANSAVKTGVDLDGLFGGPDENGVPNYEFP